MIGRLEDVRPLLDVSRERPLEERVAILEIAVSTLKQRLRRLEAQKDRE